MTTEVLGVPLNELTGYLASGLLLLSFMMRKIRTLRIINTFGCLFFVIYSFMFEEILWPVVITNVAIIGINLYYLFIAPPPKS